MRRPNEQWNGAHPAAEGDCDTDGVSLTDLEAGHGLPGLGLDGPLPGDHGEVLHGGLQPLGVPCIRTQPAVHHNLLDLGNLVVRTNRTPQKSKYNHANELA